jgi:hypothetical protein
LRSSIPSDESGDIPHDSEELGDSEFRMEVIGIGC